MSYSDEFLVSVKEAGMASAVFDQHDARAVDYVFLAACDGGAILLSRPRKLAVVVVSTSAAMALAGGQQDSYGDTP